MKKNHCKLTKVVVVYRHNGHLHIHKWNAHIVLFSRCRKLGGLYSGATRRRMGLGGDDMLFLH